MAIDFPNSPSNNDEFTVGTTTWVYNGTAWVVSLGDASIATGSITTDKIADDAVTAEKLANTAVSAGTYTTANITVDEQGRLTSASSGVGFDAFDDQVFLATQIWS